jgi:hypothetical protein
MSGISIVNHQGWAAVSAMLLALSCGDGGTEPLPPPVATAISANSSTSLTATAGTAVPEQPSVIVQDQRDDPMTGVTVTFAVTGGGGSVTGGSAVTNSAGVATVGAWVLGTTAGTNTLSATAADLPAVSFVATGTAGPAAAVVKRAGDEQTASVGSTVPTAPSVTVQDANGNPVSGVTVVFAPATNDGSSVTGGTQVTNAAGIATVGTWNLGTVAGTKVLTATVTGLPAASFVASAIAGPPALVTTNRGDLQTAVARTAVEVAPSVIVTDMNGNPVPSVVVTFAVASGGGTVTGATATSNSAGVATVGSWTLGNPGENTLTATVTGIAPATFKATALDPCRLSTQHFITTTTTGQLTNADCQRPSGAFIDYFEVPRNNTIGTMNGYVFRQTSSFDTYLFLEFPDGWRIAENDDDGTSKNSAIKVIVRSGTYRLGASSFHPNITGEYTVSSAGATLDVTNCEKVFVTRGVTTVQQLTASDCSHVYPGAYHDEFLIWGQTLGAAQIMVTMQSSAFNPHVELYDATGTLVAKGSRPDPNSTDSRIIFTPPAGPGSYYTIRATSESPGATGGYSLNILQIG